ncbi:hypothetical protein AWH56_002895 [Anaerobacillus isosaccharinicus]|uniref:Uncharacterized protein n=1 Tax=Anaerobacillus isosaccharinicus TaxID=1532552 RepID=A0A1S2MFZ6_9BACI|nr:hypothetical protein [Anaerobacillus isosaccharinicus]MBA5585010.1 hypothetical protein [Anaerobacillus isosaccharinicus]QOY36637.1 hypothetical protein AWH56_002895 [Anaerobacillus isosaccharinicus]
MTVTATWFDLYFENWDYLFKKLNSAKSKYPLCLRGVYSSHQVNDDWLIINLRKKSISKGIKSRTFCKVHLSRKAFRTLEMELNEIKEKSMLRELTFFGTIEKEDSNIIGKAYYRKQVFIRPLKKELRQHFLTNIS